MQSGGQSLFLLRLARSSFQRAFIEVFFSRCAVERPAIRSQSIRLVRPRHQQTLGHSRCPPFPNHDQQTDPCLLSSLPQQTQLRARCARPWMSANRKQTNFDGLLAAWLAALDTHQLNKKFYGELFAWFERPRQQAKFPKAPNPEEPLICLIPGFLFVWFLKEKNLIAPALFRETYIALLLKNYDATPMTLTIAPSSNSSNELPSLTAASSIA